MWPGDTYHLTKSLLDIFIYVGGSLALDCVSEIHNIIIRKDGEIKIINEQSGQIGLNEEANQTTTDIKLYFPTNWTQESFHKTVILSPL